MTTIFWAGKLSPLMKVLVNASNLIAWITGNARDTNAMKLRMKNGYEGKYSTDVTRYDELGLAHYTKIANDLLSGIEVQNKEMVDIGCGTGILSLLALERGASRIVCGDISEFMLGQCRAKLNTLGYDATRADYRTIDAEELPFSGDSFDLAVSSMVLGLVPNQFKVVSEMARIVRPGGYIALAVQGPHYYAEAIDAAFRVIPKSFVIGYRIEFWPLNEKKLKKLFQKAGLTDIKTRYIVWKDNFESSGELLDFFSATSSSWWYAKFPADKIADVSDKTKLFLEQKGIKQLTQGVAIAYGRKPGY